MARVALLLLLAGIPAVNVPDDAKMLQGRWEVVSVTTNAGDGTPAMGSLVVEEDRFRMENTRVLRKGTVRRDPKADPQTFTMRIVAGGNEREIYGIYKLENGKYVECTTLLDPEAQVPPADFVAPAGTKNHLRIWRRSDAQPGDAKRDMLEGTWELEQETIGGKTIYHDESIGSFVLRLRGETFEESLTTRYQGVLRIDPAQRPGHMDLDMSVSFQKRDEGGRVVGVERESFAYKALYELDGDSLRICIGRRNSRRPEKIVASPGSNVMTYKRIIKG